MHFIYFLKLILTSLFYLLLILFCFIAAILQAARRC